MSDSASEVNGAAATESSLVAQNGVKARQRMGQTRPDFTLQELRRLRGGFFHFIVAVLTLGSCDAAAGPLARILAVERSAGSDNILIQNLSISPIMMLGVTIDDGSNCQTGTTFTGGTETGASILTFAPKEIKSGGQLLVYNRLRKGGLPNNGCKLIQAEVQTDRGSETFAIFP